MEHTILISSNSHLAQSELQAHVAGPGAEHVVSGQVRSRAERLAALAVRQVQPAGQRDECRGRLDPMDGHGPESRVLPNTDAAVELDHTLGEAVQVPVLGG